MCNVDFVQSVDMYAIMMFLPMVIVNCKHFLIFSFINLWIFQISGLGILIAGIVVLNDVMDFNHFLDGRLAAPPVILIVTGLLIFVIAFLGCYGALKESPKLLMAVSNLFQLQQSSTENFVKSRKNLQNLQLWSKYLQSVCRSRSTWRWHFSRRTISSRCRVCSLWRSWPWPARRREFQATRTLGWTGSSTPTLSSWRWKSSARSCGGCSSRQPNFCWDPSWPRTCCSKSCWWLPFWFLWPIMNSARWPSADRANKFFRFPSKNFVFVIAQKFFQENLNFPSFPVRCSSWNYLYCWNCGRHCCHHLQERLTWHSQHPAHEIDGPTEQGRSSSEHKIVKWRAEVMCMNGNLSIVGRHDGLGHRSKENDVLRRRWAEKLVRHQQRHRSGGSGQLLQTTVHRPGVPKLSECRTVVYGSNVPGN